MQNMSPIWRHKRPHYVNVPNRLLAKKKQYNKRHEILFSHTLTEEDRANLGKEHWYGHLPMSQERSRENVLTILWFQ
jgi:hypothetical protein